VDVSGDWTELPNLFLDFPGYDCFACSPWHAQGFRLKFYRLPGEEAVAAPIPAPGPGRDGFPGVLHGGFQSLLLDEVMCWAALHLAGKIVFTGDLSVRFKKPAPSGRAMLAKGWVEKDGGRLVRARGVLMEDGDVLAEGSGSFFVPTAAGFAASLGLAAAPGKFLPYLRP